MFGFNEEANERRTAREAQAALTDSTMNNEEEIIMMNDNHHAVLTTEVNTPAEQANDSTISTTAKLPSLDTLFTEASHMKLKINNKLTISPQDYKAWFDMKALEEIYTEELVGEGTFRFNPNKTKISDLKAWKVEDGKGFISIYGQPIGFFYTDGRSDVDFKARLGYSQKLKRNICIIRTDDEKFIVPDYMFFRGYLINEKKNFSRCFNLSYATVPNWFNHSVTSECPDEDASDSFFNLLAMALMGGLSNHGISDL